MLLEIQVNWIDRLLMIAELVVLIKMLRMDSSNSKAIQQFLAERSAWYSRRAKLKQLESTVEEKPPILPENSDETVVVLSESEPPI